MYSDYWRSLSPENKQKLAIAVNTTTNYLRHVMYGRKNAGWKMARELHNTTDGNINKSVLRPDIYPPKGQG